MLFRSATEPVIETAPTPAETAPVIRSTSPTVQKRRAAPPPPPRPATAVPVVLEGPPVVDPAPLPSTSSPSSAAEESTPETSEFSGEKVDEVDADEAGWGLGETEPDLEEGSARD